MEDNQQQIVSLFLEEAQEHLYTLEQGLTDLTKVADDPEAIDEMFRAAHTIKGGSAMLGFASVQKTAHRLEDSFKILKENEVLVDEVLESLFLKGYDTLHDLLDRLGSPHGLSDVEGEEIVQSSASCFDQLESYLHRLVSGETITPTPVSAPVPQSSSLSSEQEQLAEKIKTLLKEMLLQFREKATPEGRKKLQGICIRLAKLATKEKNWQLLTKSCHQAVANPKFSYRTLAPIVIQELKKGGDLLVLGRSQEISQNESLKQLAEAQLPQILIPVEPKAAAKALAHVFNKKQLSQLVQLLAAEG